MQIQQVLKAPQPSNLLTARHAPNIRPNTHVASEKVTVQRRAPVKQDAGPMGAGPAGCAVQRQLFAVENADEGDEGTPILCTEYVNDIFKYLYTLEVRTLQQYAQLHIQVTVRDECMH